MAASIVHCVFFKYKADISAEQRAEVLASFSRLQTACKLSTGETYIASIQVGDKNVSPEGRGKGFDHAFILTFTDRAHVEYYLDSDPAHDQFKRSFGPFLDDVFVYDFFPLALPQP